MLKSKVSVATGRVEMYLRFKGTQGAQAFETLKAQRREIEEAFGHELYWRETGTEKGQRYQIGLEMDSAASGEDGGAEKFEWLTEMAKRFRSVFEPRMTLVV